MEVSIKTPIKGRFLIIFLVRWCKGEAVISNRAGPLAKIYHWRGVGKSSEAGNLRCKGQ